MNKISKNNTWDKIRFDDLVILRRGKDLTKGKFKKGIIPVAGSNGIIGFHDISNYKGPGVTVGRSGSCGSVNYYENDFWAHNTVLAVCDFKGNNQRFIFYYLSHLNLKRFATGVSVPTLNKNLFSNLEVFNIPLKEQFNISYILSTLQKAIEKQQQIIATTQALKKSLLHELFTKGTKGEKLKESEIGLIPESWKMIKIGELGEIVTGTTPKTAISEYYKPAEYDFIAPFDIGKSCKVYDTQKKISALGLNVIRVLPKHSVLCVCIGSTIGKVGLTTKDKSATNQQINSIICDDSKINPLFVYYLLTFYNHLWTEAATPSPVPILSKGSFSKLEIPFTDDLKEQNDIAKALYVLESKVEFQQRKKTIYESLFKTLLDELMTGSIRVDKLVFNKN